MKINKIQLRNIGPYIGENNIIDVSVKKNNNIVLIGGKNGAGKTTLLNSIKIGLFGPYAFGLKSASDTYYTSLVQMFNYKEFKKEVSYFGIEVEISIIENYIENIYRFNRNWTKIKDDISEVLVIEKNNRKIDSEESEQIQTKLKEIMPPSVIDTMLFDGEKIAQIIDDNKISEYLKELINVNFNINIFDKMESDINYYIEKEKNSQSLSVEEINLIEYQKKYDESKKNLKNIIDIKKQYEKSIGDKKFKLRYLNKRFENYGGLTEKDKEFMIQSLEKLEAERKNNLSIIKEFLEEDAVFYLNKKRLKNIKKSLDMEKPLLLLQYVREIGEYLGENEVYTLKNKFEKIIGEEKNEIKYNSSKKLYTDLEIIFEKFNKRSNKDLKLLLSNNKEDLINSKEYKKIISNNTNDNARDLKELLDEIKTFEKDIKELEEKLKEIDKDLKIIENENKVALIELENAEKKINENKKEENSFNIARNILKISKEYKDEQLKTIMSKISDISVKKFEEINKKENYISKIEIDKETYDIKIYDNVGIEKSITILSAGEKQLLISAIVWAVFKLSDRNNMFIFDTPLARLDKENRELFVEKVLCTISDQVFILSTNEEIVGNLYKVVKKQISKQYILINDEKEGKTVVEEGYFE